MGLLKKILLYNSPKNVKNRLCKINRWLIAFNNIQKGILLVLILFILLSTSLIDQYFTIGISCFLLFAIYLFKNK